MPTLNQLLADHDLTSGQLLDMQIAYDESPDGFERIAADASQMDRPTGYLITLIRNGAHLKSDAPKHKKRPTVTWRYVLDASLSLYRHRIEEYPLADEPGWTIDDAIAYAVDRVTYVHGGFSADEVERKLRLELDQPWDEHSDPALGAPCPLELRSRMRVRSRQIGMLRLPDDDDGAKAPSEEPTESLAAVLARTRSDT